MRHSPSPRNRKKILHHAKALRDEMEHVRDELERTHARTVRLLDSYRYTLGRMNRVMDRLNSEVGDA